GNLELHLPLERRHVDLRAERRLHHRDRHLAVEVRPFALEQRVRADRDHDVEIAVRTAGNPGLAFTRQAQPRAIVDAGRDPHVERLLALDAALPAAIAAAMAHDLARTRARVARPGDAEEALLEHDLAAAAAAAARLRRGTRSGARALTRLARAHLRNLDR